MKRNIQFGFSTTWNNIEHFEKLIGSIVGEGFSGIEPTFLPGKLPSPDTHIKDAGVIRSIADSHSITIPSMRGGRGFWTCIPSGDESVRQQGMEYAQKALETLALLQGDVLLVVPGQLSSTIPYNVHWERAVTFARSIGTMAISHHIAIGLENTEAGFPRNLQDWKKFLTEINHENVGMYLDIGNIVWQDVGDPVEWIHELAPWIRRIHFKDAYRGERLVQLLEGEVDWPAVMKALDDIVYEGWIIAEPDWYRWAPDVVPKHVMASLQAIAHM